MVEHQSGDEHDDRAAQGHQGSARTLQAQVAEPQQIDRGQAAHQIGPHHRHRGEGGVGQPPDQPQHQPGQQPHHLTQDGPQSGEQELDQGGEQTALEGELQKGQAQQVGHRGDHREAAEIPHQQGHGEGHGPHSDSQGASRPPAQSAERAGLLVLFLFRRRKEPGHIVPHPPGEGQNPRHRGKGELKTHAQRGPGVLEQEEQQGQGQAGGRVVLPAQQRSQQQQAVHNGGPDHRGGTPHRQGVAHHQRQHHQGGAAAVAAAGEGHRQLDQKAHMEPRHRHGVGQPRPPEGVIVPLGQARGVAGEEGGDQSGALRREGGGHGLLDGL